jgi:hypothetical protein
MRRRFTQQEQLLIVLGALVVLLLLVYGVITGVTRSAYGNAKESLKEAKKSREAAIDLRQRYEAFGREIEIRKERISQQNRNFDLGSFIGEVEAELNFPHKVVTSPSQRDFAGGKYTGTRITYTYDGKRLADIVKFLYKIEDPNNGIIITNIKLVADEATGTRFTMTIILSVVTENPD